MVSPAIAMAGSWLLSGLGLGAGMKIAEYGAAYTAAPVTWYQSGYASEAGKQQAKIDYSNQESYNNSYIADTAAYLQQRYLGNRIDNYWNMNQTMAKMYIERRYERLTAGNNYRYRLVL